MVSLKGMIIRSSSIIPEIREAIFRCLVCGYYTDPVVIERGEFEFQRTCSFLFEWLAHMLVQFKFSVCTDNGVY